MNSERPTVIVFITTFIYFRITLPAISLEDCKSESLVMN